MAGNKSDVEAGCAEPRGISKLIPFDWSIRKHALRRPLPARFLGHITLDVGKKVATVADERMAINGTGCLLGCLLHFPQEC